MLNPAKHKIVQFPDGKYAIRAGNYLFGFRFLDLKTDHEVWWSKEDSWFKDCITSDLDFLINKMSYGDII